jgi:hypothetical protein
MSPGFDRPEYQEDFRRVIPGECLYCHNGLPDAGQISGALPDAHTSLAVILAVQGKDDEAEKSFASPCA